MARVSINVSGLISTAKNLILDIKEAKRRGESHEKEMKSLDANISRIKTLDKKEAAELERETKAWAPAKKEIVTPYFKREAKEPGYKVRERERKETLQKQKVAAGKKKAAVYVDDATGIRVSWEKADGTRKTTEEVLREADAKWDKLSKEEQARKKEIALIQRPPKEKEKPKENPLYHEGRLKKLDVLQAFMDSHSGRRPTELFNRSQDAGGGEAATDKIVESFARELATTHSDDKYPYDVILKAVRKYLTSLYGGALQHQEIEEIPGVDVSKPKKEKKEEKKEKRTTMSGQYIPPEEDKDGKVLKKLKKFFSEFGRK